MNPRDLLQRISDRGREAFQLDQTIRSYSEYLEDVMQDPALYSRNAARYIAEMFDFYGTTSVQTSEGERKRWRLFDAPFGDSSIRPLIGQEYMQARLYQAIRSFAREGRTDKIILMHGPNGSGKTTISDLMFRALENYSRQPEGVLYRYSWVFPSKHVTGGKLGFRQQESSGVGFTSADVERDDSYAHLDESEVDLRMACELRDHPLFLIPMEDRRQLLQDAYDATGQDFHGDLGPGPHILEGEPCHKCRQIYDALLTEYRGDMRSVLRHIRVERCFISRRYRRAASTVSPQLHVDAAEAQVTSDRSLGALPAALQTLTMFTPMGDLIDANGGLMEFSDFLKRPMDLNHYLLNTVEKEKVQLRHSTVHLNMVMLATSNESHLDAFKKIALWPSFKARLELVAAPYLLEYSREEKVYDETVAIMSQRKHVAPRVAEIAALWAVLTRLQRPDPERYPSEFRAVVRDLLPVDKAHIYNHGGSRKELSSDERMRLMAAREWMKRESYRAGDYEGRSGASPREMKQVLLYSLYDGSAKCVTPMDVFRQIESLIQDKSVHAFLSLEPDGAYQNPAAFLEDVKNYYLDRISEDIRGAMDLVSAGQYEELFLRYLMHAKAQVSGETIRNPQTGKEEKPDQDLLKEVESVIGAGEDIEVFRGSVISRIGAWRIENPDAEDVDYSSLFPELITRLRDDFYSKHAVSIDRIQENLLRYGTEDFGSLEDELKSRVEGTVRKLIDDHGYCEHCAKEMVVFLRQANASTS